MDEDGQKKAHIPVLLREVLEILEPKEGEIVLDCTLGLGGHAKAFAEHIGKGGMLFGLDADKENLQEAQKNLPESAKLFHANFRDLADLDISKCDVIFADLGLSSPHLDIPARGFTFRHDAPLDLRFDQTQGFTATELIASSSEEELTDFFRDFGEIRAAQKLARIVKKQQPDSTHDLRACADEAGMRNILPQIFQALRIAVNDELGALKALLECAPTYLNTGGRFGVISYHSLEDRLVKRAFKALVTPEKDPVTGADVAPTTFRLLTKKPIVPSEEEVQKNPRARSAKFRALFSTEPT